MVFCFENCSDREKLLKIYSNCERSAQCLKQDAVLSFSWRFLRSNTLEQLESKLEEIIGM